MSNKENNVKTKDVVVYTESNYKDDQDKFEQSIKTGKVDFKNFQRLMLHDICTNTSIIETGCIGDVKMCDIELALKYKLSILLIHELSQRIIL